MKSQYVCIKTATLLYGKLYVKTFSKVYVNCNNGYVVFIVKNITLLSLRPNVLGSL